MKEQIVNPRHQRQNISFKLYRSPNKKQLTCAILVFGVGKYELTLAILLNIFQLNITLIVFK